MKRTRADGWKHAKISGHENEQLVREKVLTDSKYSERLAQRLHKGGSLISEALGGGIREKNVASILGGRTKSKTDMKINWNDRDITRISIKKSTEGQVFLISVERFVRGYELYYGVIPSEVIRGLSLLFGGATDVLFILQAPKLRPSVPTGVRRYEIRKRRLVWASLEAYSHDVALATLAWLRANSAHLAHYCFSRGLAADHEEWASHVWYINLLAGEQELDHLYDIDHIADACARAQCGATAPGAINCGSTIQLPFGCVQWHQGKLQFRHSMEKLECIVDRER